MFDDGAHNDGLANDKKYGASVTMSSGLCQYYIYAESADAAKLSPERAEFEFYTVNSTISKVNKGDVVINEFMASNIATAKDSAGDYDDWVELCNITNNAVDLTGWYLTDDYTNKSKWKFSNGATILAHSYIIVWCDNQPGQAGLHTTFKLNNSGEKLMLIQTDTSIVDSITYGKQRSDTSFARIPNGTGSFQFRKPTFNNRNDTPAIGITFKNYDLNKVSVYPNPGKGKYSIVSNVQFIATIYDLNGREVLSTSNKFIDLSGFEEGMYIFKLISENGTVQIVKVIQQK
jgi:hypothetical protein